jgi:hypothetical protein
MERVNGCLRITFMERGVEIKAVFICIREELVAKELGVDEVVF